MALVSSTNLEDYGYRELDLACDLLQAIKRGYPDDFDDDEVQFMVNNDSGNVFLTNSSYQVAIEINGKLFSWYTLPYSGIEGTAMDLYEEFTDGDIKYEEDLEYLIEIFEESTDAEDNWVDEVRKAIE